MRLGLKPENDATAYSARRRNGMYTFLASRRSERSRRKNRQGNAPTSPLKIYAGPLLTISCRSLLNRGDDAGGKAVAT